VKVTSIGKSNEDRDLLIVFVGSDESIKNLEAYRGYLGQLADPRTLTEAQAKEVIAKAKPIYHASAVFASNYFVVVEAVAQRLLRHAGLSDAEAWQALRPLVEGTFENLSRQEPIAALTGPVERGDVATIRRHLEALTHDDAVLYRALGRAALELAQKRGMDEATAAQVAAALATDLPPVLRPGART